MADRSSRPHHSPRRTRPRLERKVLHLRATRRWGPARIAGRLGMCPSTVHKVLTRHRVARLAHLDRATARPVRRYEHPACGDLIHVDVKKLGNIPDGGGWRTQGRRVGRRNRQRHPSPARNAYRNPILGYSYLRQPSIGWSIVTRDGRPDNGRRILRVGGVSHQPAAQGAWPATTIRKSSTDREADLLVEC